MNDGAGRRGHHWFAGISHLICQLLQIPVDTGPIQSLLNSSHQEQWMLDKVDSRESWARDAEPSLWEGAGRGGHYLLLPLPLWWCYQKEMFLLLRFAFFSPLQHTNTIPGGLHKTCSWAVQHGGLCSGSLLVGWVTACSLLGPTLQGMMPPTHLSLCCFLLLLWQFSSKLPRADAA